MIIEVCANSFSSALIAQNAGAHRIELCQDLILGGTTPSAGTIQLVKQHLDIPVYVLIRPRSGDFIYNENEINVMIQDILFCKQNGIDGVVIGAIDNKGEIDIKNVQRLVDIARPMSITFHRAFDRTQNPMDALQTLIDMGINRVLTSGQQATAIEGIDLIKKLMGLSDGRIKILVGGGVNAQNIAGILQACPLNEIHLSGKSLIKSPMQTGTALNATILPEHDYYQSDISKINRVIQQINSIFES